MLVPPLLLLPFVLSTGLDDAPSAPPNLLILVADDVGVDQLASYGEGADVPQTPYLNKLAKRGVLFRNAWATPWCSPTRASIVTGRYGFRTGIGSYLVTGDVEAFALPLDEVTLPELFDLGTGGAYQHAAIGKWHLGNATVGGPLAPNLAGWGDFGGIDGNIKAPNTYFLWPKTVNGNTFVLPRYATTDTVDTTLKWIDGAQEPWVAYVAFNAIHTPLHVPPKELFQVDVSSADPHLNPRPYYVAAAEAMDAEIGRLLKTLGGQVLSRTNIVFVGDNGSPKDMVVPPIAPWQHKGTHYEGGVRVPLLVTGPAVAEIGSEVGALVHVADLFATAAELAGIDLAATLPAGHALDSVSLVPYLADPAHPPLRDTVYTESFFPNGLGEPEEGFRAVRDARYKLVQPIGDVELLYDLWLDPDEATNLLEGKLSTDEQGAYASLSAELNALAGP
ncbi:MAG: sulfatase-like hydrolase/transferase [Planctomycetota bacterium]